MESVVLFFISVSIIDILKEAEVIPALDLVPPQDRALDRVPDLRITGSVGQGHHRQGEGHETDATEIKTTYVKEMTTKCF